ncbi:cbb3-type cytochrome oxidase assembly protein CcoS [Arenimonas sp. GDDSR-1]|uniref:cbb3-type cytochrome oxidase assembly protein CcoS n=1 Tax=Arenimonas sp. GDDSR-1 TaxID=2950125 RepID=UPI00263113E5|nr:cbb3-type cytochrome oxidase assembly protein CcoS [Arenimonas sp. GDDSR-1]
MNILLALIPISLVLLIVGILAFFWAVRKGQFDNLDAAALDILTDDSKPMPDKKSADKDTPDNAG